MPTMDVLFHTVYGARFLYMQIKVFLNGLEQRPVSTIQIYS